jgi:hypothetical protein
MPIYTVGPVVSPLGSRAIGEPDFAGGIEAVARIDAANVTVESS